MSQVMPKSGLYKRFVVALIKTTDIATRAMPCVMQSC